MKRAFVLNLVFAIVFAAASAFGQVPSPASANNIDVVLSQLTQVARQTANDVADLNIRKWKTDSAYKDQFQHDASSIAGNVSSALPNLIAQVRANPANVAVEFKLYRNVDALYDVLKGLAESAGAFGKKEEYSRLRADVEDLSSTRNALASHLETIAVATQAELLRLRAQAAQAAAAAAAPPKKIVIDDNELPKKPVKKPRRKKTTKSSSETQTPPQ